MRLVYTGYPHLPEYRAGDVAVPWPVGEAREVAAGVAARLLADHPSAFTAAGDIDQPPADRAMRAPAGKRAGR